MPAKASILVWQGRLMPVYTDMMESECDVVTLIGQVV